MRWSFKAFYNVSFVVAFNDSPDPGIGCDILSPFHRSLVSTNELLVQAVTSFLNSSDAIYKFPNCGVVHSKFCLQSCMSCFNMVVGTVISIKRPLVDRHLIFTFMALFACGCAKTSCAETSCAKTAAPKRSRQNGGAKLSCSAEDRLRSAV